MYSQNHSFNTATLPLSPPAVVFCPAVCFSVLINPSETLSHLHDAARCNQQKSLYPATCTIRCIHLYLHCAPFETKLQTISRSRLITPEMLQNDKRSLTWAVFLLHTAEGQRLETETKTVASSVAGDCRFPVVIHFFFFFCSNPHPPPSPPLTPVFIYRFQTHTFLVAWQNNCSL